MGKRTAKRPKPLQQTIAGQNARHRRSRVTYGQAAASQGEKFALHSGLPYKYRAVSRLKVWVGRIVVTVQVLWRRVWARP